MRIDPESALELATIGIGRVASKPQRRISTVVARRLYLHSRNADTVYLVESRGALLVAVLFFLVPSIALAAAASLSMVQPDGPPRFGKGPRRRR
jgi:hypothetical protein